MALILLHFTLCGQENVEDTLGFNFFIPSVIKTISGDSPQNELFDLTFNINAGAGDTVSRWNFFGSVDLNISNTSTDSIKSSTSKLFDANIAINYDVRKESNWAKQKLRLYIGPQLRIYNTHAFYGFHFGGMLVENDFYSSFFNIGYIRPLNRAESISDNPINGFNHNMLTEFAFTSNSAPILKDIRIKGAIIFPLSEESTDENISSRITIQIPIGGIFLFNNKKKGNSKPTQKEPNVF